jgi:DNA repair exonuclease SbcCD ATPase subunit
MNRATEHRGATRIAQLKSQIAFLEQEEKTASKDLAAIVVRITEEAGNLSQLEKKLHEVDELLNTKRSFVASLAVAEHELLESIAGLTKERDTLLQSTKEIADSAQAQLKIKIDKLQDIVESDLATIKLQRSIISDNNKIIDGQLDKIKGKGADYTSVMASLDGIVDEYSGVAQKLADVKAAYTEAEKQLDGILKQIEIEKEKIALPLQSLWEASAELDKKKRDIDIYASRIQTRFRQLFPGQSMKF